MKGVYPLATSRGGRYLLLIHLYLKTTFNLFCQVVISMALQKLRFPLHYFT